MFFNKPSEQYHHLADQATPVLNRATEQASALAHRGVDSASIRQNSCATGHYASPKSSAMSNESS